MAIDLSPPQIVIAQPRRAVPRICLCGSNRQWHSILVGLELIGAVFYLALLVYAAALNMDSEEGLFATLLALAITLIHLMFVLTAVRAEQARNAKCMKIWSTYTKALAVLCLLGGFGLFLERKNFGTRLLSWLFSAFMSVMLALLSSKRYDELVLEGNGEGRILVVLQQQSQMESGMTAAAATTTKIPDQEMIEYNRPPPAYEDVV